MPRRHPQPRLRPARYYRCSCQTTARLHGQPFRDYIHFLPMGLDPWSGGCQGGVARAIYSYPLGPGMLRIRVIESICQSQLGMPSAEPLQTDVRQTGGGNRRKANRAMVTCGYDRSLSFHTNSPLNALANRSCQFRSDALKANRIQSIA